MATPRAPAMAPGSFAIAPLGPRFLAGLIDGFIPGFVILIFYGVAFGLAIVLGPDNALSGIVAMLAGLICFGIVLFYEPFFLGVKGATPGKKMMKLRVQLQDGTCPIGFGKALLRVLCKAIGGSVCLITYIMILLDKEKHLALHDKIAGTIVVQDMQ